jgi:ABC-type amino acid transport substrate-binding protein
VVTPTHRVSVAVGYIAITIWIWALAAGLLLIRWAGSERPAPPVYAGFPYGEVRVGIDGSYPPFAVADADGNAGLDVDIAQRIGDRLGYPVRLVNLGYDGLYDALRTDQVDVLISALRVDPLRTGDVLYTTPYIDTGLVLVTRGECYTTPQDALRGQRVAYALGSAADEALQRFLREVPSLTLAPYESSSIALRAYQHRDTSAVLIGWNDLRMAGKEVQAPPNCVAPVTHQPLAIAIRRDRVATWRLVEDILLDLLATGEIERLIDTWF